MSTEKIVTKASIAGTVTDSVTGIPLAGVSIQITGTNMVSETGDDGFYFFVNLPAGACSLTVSIPGAGSRYGITNVSGVNVGTDQKGVPKLDIKANVAVIPTCLQGVIRSASNSAVIAGAKISVVGSDVYTMSKADGTYTLTGLYEGKPDVQFSATGFKTVIKKATLTKGVITHMNVNLQQ